MALTVAITLTSAAGDALSDAIQTSLSTSYTVDKANEIKKVKLTGSAQQVIEADEVGAKLLVIKNVGTTAGTHFVKIHNSATDNIATTRVATLDVGEIATIPVSGGVDIYATGTADEYVEIMAFTISAADRA